MFDEGAAVVTVSMASSYSFDSK